MSVNLLPSWLEHNPECICCRGSRPLPPCSAHTHIPSQAFFLLFWSKVTKTGGTPRLAPGMGMQEQKPPFAPNHQHGRTLGREGRILPSAPALRAPSCLCTQQDCACIHLNLGLLARARCWGHRRNRSRHHSCTDSYAE